MVKLGDDDTNNSVSWDIFIMTYFQSDDKLANIMHMIHDAVQQDQHFICLSSVTTRHRFDQ